MPKGSVRQRLAYPRSRHQVGAGPFQIVQTMYGQSERRFSESDLEAAIINLGKLAHQDLGQMQMYVNYFDRHTKTDAEAATIGIVLCKKKHEALVEITPPKDANIHAMEYQLYLPSKEELLQKLTEWAGIGNENSV